MESSENKFPIFNLVSTLSGIKVNVEVYIRGRKGDVYDFMLFFERLNLLPIKA